MRMQLKHPVTIDGAEIAAVNVRRPTGDDMIVIGDHLAALMKMAGGGEGAAPVLDASVFLAIREVVGALTGLGANAGKLDFVDLQDIATVGMSGLGEAAGSDGDQTTGAA